MTQLVGIIAEYNPFHLGHQYQLEQVKSHYPQATIVVLMSGNVVQRGEFAILDKWQRAELALHGGADLVIELPTIVSIQSADYFAKHSVTLLAGIGCEVICFGTETASKAQLCDYLQWEQLHQTAIDTQLQGYLKQGYAYPAAYQQAVDTLRGEVTFNPFSPNHQLGIQYLRQNQSLGRPMQVMVLPRVISLSEAPILSGSQIRQAIRQQQLTVQQVPSQTFDCLATSDIPCMADYWPLLRYQLLSQPETQLRLIAGMKEGVERRMKRLAATVETYDALVAHLINKRWTRAAVQRLLLAVLLQLPQAELSQLNQGEVTITSLRVLGFNEEGQRVLKDTRTSDTMHLFTNYKKIDEVNYQWNLQADQIFQLNPRCQIAQQYRTTLPWG